MFFKRKKFYTLLDIKNQIVYTPLIFIFIPYFSGVNLVIFGHFMEKYALQIYQTSIDDIEQSVINPNLSNEEKEQKYQDFYNECIQKMNNYNFYSLDHFERKPNSDDLQNFLKAIEARTKQNSNEYIVLVPITESYESRNGNKFAWIFGAFGIGITVFLLLGFN